MLLICLLALVCLLFKWVLPKGKRLPPGSLGWPYIGETLKLCNENPNTFFSNRQERYGNVFKTHLLGRPCVMVSSPEAVRTVVTHPHLFKRTYPTSKEQMIGPEAIFFQEAGEYNAMLKRFVQAPFLPSAIKNSVSDIEKIVLKPTKPLTPYMR